MTAFRPFALFIVFTLLLCGCSKDEGTMPEYIRLVGHVEIQGSLITDVWEYVSPENKYYAIVGDFSNLLSSNSSGSVTIVDVTTPGNPTIAAVIDDADGFDMKVWEQYLYVANGGGNISSADDKKSRIYDLSDPSHPVFVGEFIGAHNIFIDDKGYLYAEGTFDTEGMSVYDLNADPTAPNLVWSDDTGTAGHDVSVIRDRIYDFHANQTRIYDGSDPTAPVLLGVIDDAGIFSHSGWVTEDDNFLFIADEGKPDFGMDISIWDISDPSQPVMVGSVSDPDFRSHNIYIIGDLMYASFYGAGFRLYDVSSPATPVLLDSFDTAMGGEGLGGGFNGAFGVYPFSPSGYVYVSDMDNGLFVFEVSEP